MVHTCHTGGLVALLFFIGLVVGALAITLVYGAKTAWRFTCEARDRIYVAETPEGVYLMYHDEIYDPSHITVLGPDIQKEKVQLEWLVGPGQSGQVFRFGNRDGVLRDDRIEVRPVYDDKTRQELPAIELYPRGVDGLLNIWQARCAKPSG